MRNNEEISNAKVDPVKMIWVQANLVTVKLTTGGPLMIFERSNRDLLYLNVIDDCNDAVNTGRYVISNSAHAPASYGFLDVQNAYSGRWIYQVAHITNGLVMTRYNTNNSGWTIWTSLASKDDLGVTKSVTASGTKTVPDGGAVADVSISAGTWLVWGYAGAQKVRIQDNASNHMIYKAGINPQSVITVTATTNLQLVNISGSDLSVWADATNYYLMAMRLK